MRFIPGPHKVRMTVHGATDAGQRREASPRFAFRLNTRPANRGSTSAREFDGIGPDAAVTHGVDNSWGFKRMSSGRGGSWSGVRICETRPHLRNSINAHQPGSHSPGSNPNFADPGNA